MHFLNDGIFCFCIIIFDFEKVADNGECSYTTKQKQKSCMQLVYIPDRACDLICDHFEMEKS